MILKNWVYIGSLSLSLSLYIPVATVSDARTTFLFLPYEILCSSWVLVPSVRAGE